jgi:hypothetical protein
LKPWIGVDLDGTLAVYDQFQGHTHIGDPIPAMVERVKRWLAEGQLVKVFTARGGELPDGEEKREVHAVIHVWCETHIGVRLEVTNVKDYGMVELWDDRCVTVESNTGRPLAPSRRGLL